MAITKPNVFLSIDVETTGPGVSVNSCNMIGITVFRDIVLQPDTKISDWLIETRAWYIREIPDKPMDKKCYDNFWSKNLSILEKIREKAVGPYEAMEDFAYWFNKYSIQYNCKFVMRPASFDMMWLNDLYYKYGPIEKPTLPHSAICVSTLINSAKIFWPEKTNEIENMLKHPTLGMSHMADDDSAYQAYMYLKMMSFMKANVIRSVLFIE